VVSPQSRGRPPGRGRPRPPRSRSAGGARVDHGQLSELNVASEADAASCWFDEPAAGDRESWAMPSGHGSYRGLELEWLDPGDEDQLMLLLEARHTELGEALRSGEEVIVEGEPFSPGLHLAMHQIVANQLLADDPLQTWQTVQRLAGLGYDWHNIMHMIARLLSDDLHTALTERREFDAADYARRLAKLPGDWPPPQAPEPP
jgi:Domain of unknown function (DUF1841)